IRYLLQFADGDIRWDGTRPIHMFRSGVPEKSMANAGAFLSISLVGSVVGAVHFVAWNSHFPTPFLRIIWKTGTIVLLAVPGWYPPLVAIYAFTPLRRMRLFNGLVGLQTQIAWISYVVARLTLMVLAILIPLKYGLPDSGYREVDWLQFLPHIG
ncbi:hypothetical protein V5O48_014494, partial [Marasmius crinis-equi]